MKKKRILLIASGLYPDMNASSEIVYRLAGELQKLDCMVSIMGYHNIHNYRDEPDPLGLHTVTLKGIDDFSKIMQNGKSKIWRILQLAVNPRALRYYFRQSNPNAHEVLCLEYREEISRELRKNKYDCVVAFLCPLEAVLGVMKCETKIPLILYKLDPWTINSYYRADLYPQKFLISEAQADSRANAIITTPLVVREYYEKSAIQFQSKVTAVEFPNVIERNLYRENLFDANSIHCVFTGVFYKDIRTPDYAISLLGQLKKYKIVFHIVGEKQGNDTIPDILPENVICHGRVSSDEAMQYMQSADILVNIGNTVLNQMPSKILTYISLGKPILNIIKSPQCPTLPYMEKYPLALNVLETPEVQQEDVERVREFILTSRGKQIPFDKIKEKYYTCTPEYVGKQLYDVICEVVEEKKNKE